MSITSIGIKVRLLQDFSVVRETLERMGVKNLKTKKFYPSFYCVETKDPEIFAIVHFKELFAFIGKESTFDEADKTRLVTGVHLLKNWGIVEPVDDIGTDIQGEKIATLKHSEKREFEIVHKFKFSKRIIVD